MDQELSPIHPGEVLLDDFLKSLGLTQYRVAHDIGVTSIRISQIVKAQRSILVDTAMRLARYFGTSAAVRLRIAILLLMAVFCVAFTSCVPLPSVGMYLSTATPAINRDQAIEIAIGGCKIPHLVLVGEPTNIRTKLMTLAQADEQTRAAGETTNYDIPMDTLVWMVQMDGNLQLVGGPAPPVSPDGRYNTPTPAQPFWGTCTAVLDAITGRLIFIRG
jgi:addiction module HigA family antidote